jgi:hypothetical protein
MALVPMDSCADRESPWAVTGGLSTAALSRMQGRPHERYCFWMDPADQGCLRTRRALFVILLTCGLVGCGSGSGRSTSADSTSATVNAQSGAGGASGSSQTTTDSWKQYYSGIAQQLNSGLTRYNTDTNSGRGAEQAVADAKKELAVVQAAHGPTITDPKTAADWDTLVKDMTSTMQTIESWEGLGGPQAFDPMNNNIGQSTSDLSVFGHDLGLW